MRTIKQDSRPDKQKLLSIRKEKYITRYNIKQRENRYTSVQRNLKKILNCNNNLISESRNIKYDTAPNNENLIRYQRQETRYHTRQKGNIYILTYRYHPEIKNINDYTATNKKVQISNSINNKQIITSRKKETFNMIQHCEYKHEH